MNRSSMKDALLLIDLQAGFFTSETLKLARKNLVEASNKLIAAARDNGVPVFLITTEHSRDRSTWTLNMLDDDQGYLFHNDPSAELVEGLDTKDVTRVEKTRDSAWFGTDLDLRIRNLDVDRVVVAGVSTHGCIAQTVRDAYARNIRTAIASDAIADDRESYQDFMLEQLVDDRQTQLHAVDEVIQMWASDH